MAMADIMGTQRLLAEQVGRGGVPLLSYGKLAEISSVMPQINTPRNMGNINPRHYHPKQLYNGGRIKQPPRYMTRSGRKLGR